jgi:hypothetical protein
MLAIRGGGGGGGTLNFSNLEFWQSWHSANLGICQRGIERRACV